MLENSLLASLRWVRKSQSGFLLDPRLAGIKAQAFKLRDVEKGELDEKVICGRFALRNWRSRT
jgi:hypothetical protein